MNLLLITFSFPPAGGVGVLRALSLAKYLPENGIRVDVLTAGNAPSVGRDLSLLRQVPETVTVHRSWTPDLPFALRKTVKRLVGGRGAPLAGSRAQGTGGGGNPLKRWLGNLLGDLLLPDPQVGWLPFAFRRARRIVRSRGIDAVLVTVPPFSSVRLATLLRREFPALPIVVDFRDEWLSTLDLVSFNKNERARRVAHTAESEAVRDATAVVAVTEAARLELLARYPGEDPSKFHCVPNGFETRAPRSGVVPNRTDQRITLTYLGSVYGSTDPASLVEAVLRLPPALRERLLLRFIGHIETETLRASLERLGPAVELKGFVPQAEALAAMDDTDFLLLITHDRINVSAKFYDYLSGGKPIVALVHPGGDVRRLLDETRTGCWADVRDIAAIAELLTGLIEGTGPCGLVAPDRERIAGYHRRPLAARYAQLLHGLILK